MKYKPPRVAAIFFWPVFYRPGGAWPPWPLPWIRYCNDIASSLFGNRYTTVTITKKLYGRGDRCTLCANIFCNFSVQYLFQD